MNKYPVSLKEAVIAGIANCTTMVLAMVTLNLYIYGHLTLANFFGALGPIWLTAFCLDFFAVGPLVRRIVEKLRRPQLMPFIRVGFMAGILTALAPVIETGIVVPWRMYLIALPRNYVAALIVQVFVAMRIGLYVLAKYRALQNRATVSK